MLGSETVTVVRPTDKDNFGSYASSSSHTISGVFVSYDSTGVDEHNAHTVIADITLSVPPGSDIGNGDHVSLPGDPTRYVVCGMVRRNPFSGSRFGDLVSLRRGA